jgi:hypothetical protein
MRRQSVSAAGGSASTPDDDPLATALRGFGPVGLLAIVFVLGGNAIVPPLSAVLALAWARLSRTPWRALGFARPASGWGRTVVAGVVVGAALKLALKVVVMPLLGADPINQRYHFLVGNRALIPATLFALVVGAGFGEETVFRGYMFERLGRLLGTNAGAKAATLLITSVLFGLAHLADQGVAGAEQATMTGLAFGAMYLATGTLWLPMCAHAAFDLTAYAIIYWDVERAVAHLVFR